MENENLEIEEYEVTNLDENQIAFFIAEELVFNDSSTTPYDSLLIITYKYEKKYYKITKQFAILLKNKTTYTLVDGPINGLFVLKVTQPNGEYFFQVVDASGFVEQDNLSKDGASNYIRRPKAQPARSIDRTLG
ncbi:hypothetical protein [Sulfurospirillum oryzae]|uniref:hypothetical protein n=1 Tax=Sulfurospirillum oryzae TaxID=2976535 RepID=UPI0021E96C3D|nr:hypothetical protein [Sulfurospirillum oryzae]